jgi:hypothetical protein
MLQALADTVRSFRRPERFIRDYQFPPGLRAKVAVHLGLADKRSVENALQGLRDFFLLCLDARGEILGMPSRAVDAAWHEFILHTREYTAFCKRAFGHYLHHLPNDDASSDPVRDLGRTWILSCIAKDEDPHSPTLVPLLFSIDAEIGLPDARVYTLDDLAALPVPPGFIETEPGRYRYIAGRPKRPAYWVGPFGADWADWFGTGSSRHGGHHGIGGHHSGGHDGHGGGGGHDGGGHGCGGGGGDGCGGGH